MRFYLISTKTFCFNFLINNASFKTFVTLTLYIGINWAVEIIFELIHEDFKLTFIHFIDEIL